MSFLCVFITVILLIRVIVIHYVKILKRLWENFITLFVLKILC